MMAPWLLLSFFGFLLAPSALGQTVDLNTEGSENAAEEVDEPKKNTEESLAIPADIAPSGTLPSDETPLLTEEEPKGVVIRSPMTWKHSGELRYIATSYPDFQVSSDGLQSRQPWSIHQRLRAREEASFGDWSVRAELDVLTGQVLGDTWTLGAGLDERRRDSMDAFTEAGISIRESAISGMIGMFKVEAGLVTSHWGLGILANNGSTEPLFGRSDFGDRVLRIRITTTPFGRLSEPEGVWKPIPLYLTLAVDQVIGDDIARWDLGDFALQGIFSLLYAPSKARRLGMYVVYRNQEDYLTGAHTQAVVVDGFGDWSAPLGTSGWTGRIAMEGVGVFGATDQVLTYSSREGLSLFSGGGAIEASIENPTHTARFNFRGGYASGDQNSDDGIMGDFAFDRDYGVGMVLFDELMGGIDAGAYALLTDPDNSGSPPRGVDGILREGALHGAAYIQPVIQVFPLDWLEFRTGMVLAWSTSPIAHPYYTFRAGGEARNHLDMPTDGRFLGGEFNWGIEMAPPPDHPHFWMIRPRVGIQGGHAMVSDNLDPDRFGRYDLFMLRVGIEW